MAEATLPRAGWAEVNAWRKARRAELRAQRLALAPAQRRALLARVLAHLEAGLPERAGLAVGFYWPFRGELDLQALMKRHVAEGGRVVLPVVVQRNAPVEWWQWEPGARLVPGIWEIPVPAERRPLAPALLLVPLLGFDGAGYRLGNGGGYYDRSLAVLAPRPLTVGVGYEAGRLETIHPQPHDIALDAIVSETGLYWPPLGGPDGAEPSSPVCYADEAAPEYFGYLDRAETLALLGGLRAGWRAWLRAHPDAPVERQREALHACALLSRGLAHLGADPNAAAEGADAGPAAPEALAGRLREALPRIRDEALHAALEGLLTRPPDGQRGPAPVAKPGAPL
jgi:5-formyltetrahydrofolate cyclo-ligase